MKEEYYSRNAVYTLIGKINNDFAELDYLVGGFLAEYFDPTRGQKWEDVHDYIHSNRSISFKTRYDIMLKILKARYPDEYDTFVQLNGKLKKVIDSRNRLAHGVIFHGEEEMPINSYDGEPVKVSDVYIKTSNGKDTRFTKIVKDFDDNVDVIIQALKNTTVMKNFEMSDEKN